MTKSIFSQEYDQLRHLLITARQQKGLTQGDVALALGKPQSFVSKYERGERRLDVVEFLQVANTLAVSPVSIIAQLESESFHKEDMTQDILKTWKITPRALTALMDQNPSLRGMLFGYVAELKLEELWLRHPDITECAKDDDHDRRKKGDRRIVYKDHSFVVEVKSLQTDSIEQKDNIWFGKAQVDASDRREITLPNGDQVNTTLLLVGEFDVLAVNVYSFEGRWDFVFAKNQDLPRTTYSKYTPQQREYLLASLIPVTWPPRPPFADNLYSLLDELVEERARRIS
jgi:transcriptional regulator with XRE-family HTH domain